MTLRDQSAAKKRKPRSHAQQLRDAYHKGVHDGQMSAMTMLAVIEHPQILEELLEGRAKALTDALRAIKGEAPDGA